MGDLGLCNDSQIVRLAFFHFMKNCGEYPLTKMQHKSCVGSIISSLASPDNYSVVWLE